VSRGRVPDSGLMEGFEHYQKRMERSLTSFVDVEEGVFEVVRSLLESLLVFEQ
jgi:hypothetical protein